MTVQQVKERWGLIQKISFKFWNKNFQQVGLSEIDIIIFCPMKHINDNSIFLEQKHESTENLFVSKLNECPDSIPYLQKGDSNSYLEQFLNIEEEVIHPPSPTNKEEIKETSKSVGKDQQYLVEQEPKFNTSSFHNFQKHLTVAIKQSIDITHSEQSSEVEKIAQKLWKAFKSSNVSTKKILHYLLGEKNEHRITPQAIKEFGLQKVYNSYDEKLVKEARIYLAREALIQIREGKLEEYLSLKKLKDKEMFRKYVELFVIELQNGFLRKRLPKESVKYLLNL